MYLRYYGWEGNQHDIDEVIKPDRADRNVNVEELDYYVRVYAGWLNVLYRVGGEIETLKALVAAGIPVMIEEGDELEEQYWPTDDKWAGHFLLLTGYDDAQGVFYAQDSFRQADRLVSYEKTDERWKPFNRVYLVVFLPHQEETVRQILGEDWDVEVNRQKALDAAQAEIDANPEDGLAWFNLGTNLVWFERYRKPPRPTTRPASSACPSECCATSSGRTMPTSIPTAMRICWRSPTTPCRSPRTRKRHSSGRGGRSTTWATAPGRSRLFGMRIGRIHEIHSGRRYMLWILWGRVRKSNSPQMAA